ncbi:MAG: glycosyltransferase, partial [Bacteroidota bacterium]|nr:glycosyltransferase [Bacteroidota bacterium]
RLFGLHHDKMTLLVIGGSLGAGTINHSTSECIEKGITSHGMQIIWQTGKAYFNTMRLKFPKESYSDVHMFPFIDRMDLAYAAADIVVSRAGAIAISELCIVGKPAILIPSPNVAEDHQTHNAEALSRKGAAILLKDQDAEARLFSVIDNLRENPDQRESLKNNIKSLGIRDAASHIAEEALKRIKRNPVK